MIKNVRFEIIRRVADALAADREHDAPKGNEHL